MEDAASKPAAVCPDEVMMPHVQPSGSGAGGIVVPLLLDELELELTMPQAA
jgi:hypothetical protein